MIFALFPFEESVVVSALFVVESATEEAGFVIFSEEEVSSTSPKSISLSASSVVCSCSFVVGSVADILEEILAVKLLSATVEAVVEVFVVLGFVSLFCALQAVKADSAINNAKTSAKDLFKFLPL